MKRTITAVTIAAIVASGATATAATMITGKQIKDGTITLRDLSARTRKALQPRITARSSAISETTAPDGTRIILVESQKGDKGDKGDSGATIAGPQGPAGRNASTDVKVLYMDRTSIPAQSYVAVRLDCPAGYVLSGIGYQNEIEGAEITAVLAHDTYGTAAIRNSTDSVQSSRWLNIVCVTAV